MMFTRDQRIKYKGKLLGPLHWYAESRNNPCMQLQLTELISSAYLQLSASYVPFLQNYSKV